MGSHYYAFLMRLWHSSDPAQGSWFISLEDPSSHQITYFKTKEDLFSFICRILDEQDRPSPAEAGTTPPRKP